MSEIVCPYIPWTGKIYHGRPYCVVTRREISLASFRRCKNSYDRCPCYIETRKKANYFEKIMNLYAKNNNAISQDDSLRTILEFERLLVLKK